MEKLIRLFTKLCIQFLLLIEVMLGTRETWVVLGGIVTYKEPIFIYFSYMYMSEVAQLCPTLCDPLDCSLPHSSIHGIFQARVLEWVAISFSRGSSQPRDRTWVSRIVGRRFII